MGLNICVVNRATGAEVSMDRWDWIRMAGDREFVSEVLSDKSMTLSVFEPEDTWYHRPIDVGAWRAWDAKQLSNKGRWAVLVDLLSSDQDLWVTVSH